MIEADMDWYGAIQALLFGFLPALPFAWIKQYVFRAALSVIVPLAMNWWVLWLLSDPVRLRVDEQLIFVVLGSLCASSVRPLWKRAFDR